MRATTGFFFICVLIGSAVAQNAPLSFSGHGKKSAIVPAPHHKGQVIVAVHDKTTPVTPPQRVGESERKKQCPAGFQFAGKQCAKTLSTAADVVCPHGTVLVDGKCAKYLGKFSKCPPGFQTSKGTCVKNTEADFETICPEGFVLSGKDTCSRIVQLPNVKVCPVGSVQRGDTCTTSAVTPPQLTCPEGYTLEGHLCLREEIFDCTPPNPNPPSKGQEVQEIDTFKTMRREPVHSKGKERARYTVHEPAPVVDEFVISKTCKRITREPARRICAPGGILDGKLCRIDSKVDYVFKKGGYRDEFIPIIRRCPLGFVEQTKGRCQNTEEVIPTLYCPANSIDLGNRCAVFSRPRTVCPTGFSFEGKECTKTIFAAPIVEFSVTYKCTGKNCDEHHF